MANSPYSLLDELLDEEFVEEEVTTAPVMSAPVKATGATLDSLLDDVYGGNGAAPQAPPALANTPASPESDRGLWGDIKAFAAEETEGGLGKFARGWTGGVHSAIRSNLTYPAAFWGNLFSGHGWERSAGEANENPAVRYLDERAEEYRDDSTLGMVGNVIPELIPFIGKLSATKRLVFPAAEKAIPALMRMPWVQKAVQSNPRLAQLAINNAPEFVSWAGAEIEKLGISWKEPVKAGATGVAFKAMDYAGDILLQRYGPSVMGVLANAATRTGGASLFAVANDAISRGEIDKDTLRTAIRDIILFNALGGNPKKKARALQEFNDFLDAKTLTALDKIKSEKEFSAMIDRAIEAKFRGIAPADIKTNAAEARRRADVMLRTNDVRGQGRYTGEPPKVVSNQPEPKPDPVVEGLPAWLRPRYEGKQRTPDAPEARVDTKTNVGTPSGKLGEVVEGTTQAQKLGTPFNVRDLPVWIRPRYTGTGEGKAPNVKADNTMVRGRQELSNRALEEGLVGPRELPFVPTQRLAQLVMEAERRAVPAQGVPANKRQYVYPAPPSRQLPLGGGQMRPGTQLPRPAQEPITPTSKGVPGEVPATGSTLRKTTDIIKDIATVISETGKGTRTGSLLGGAGTTKKQRAAARRLAEDGRRFAAEAAKEGKTLKEYMTAKGFPASHVETVQNAMNAQSQSAQQTTPTDGAVAVARDIGKKIWEKTGQPFTRQGKLPSEVWGLDRKRDNYIRAEISDAHHTAGNIERWSKKATDAEIAAVDNALSGKLPMEQVPEAIRADVQRMRVTVDNLSRIIHENLPDNKRTAKLRETIESNIGSYARRKYRINTEADWKPGPEEVTGMRDHVKRLAEKRPNSSLAKNIEGMTDQQIDKFLDQHFEARRNSLKPQRAGGLGARQDIFMQRKNVNEAVRRFYGEITDPLQRMLATVQDLSHNAYNAEFFNTIARNPKFAKTPIEVAKDPNLKSSDWVLLDNTAVKHLEGLLGPNTLAGLRGKSVPRGVYEFIMESRGPWGDISMERATLNAIDKYATQPFKWTKTIGNWATHMRNVYGNIPFAMMAKNTPFNPANWGNYTRAVDFLIDMKLGRGNKHRDLRKQLIQDEAIDTEFFGSEVWKNMSVSELREMRSSPQKFMDIVKKPFRFAGSLYNAGDVVYKVATYFKYAPEGVNATPEARAKAREMVDFFPNYRRVGKGVKWLRSVPLAGVFVSFKAEAARIYLKYAQAAAQDYKAGNLSDGAYKTLVLGSILGGATAAKEAMTNIFNISDDEMDKVQRHGSKYRRYSELIPYRNENGEVFAWDPGYILPHGDWRQLAASLSEGDLSYAQQIFLNHPIVDFITMWHSGEDPFDGRALYTEEDPLLSKVWSLSKAVFKNTYQSPSLPGGYGFDKLKAAFNEEPYGAKQEVPNLRHELLSFFLGLRVTEISSEKAQASALRKLEHRKRVIISDFKRKVSNENLKPEDVQKAEEEFLRRLEVWTADLEEVASIKGL